MTELNLMSTKFILHTGTTTETYVINLKTFVSFRKILSPGPGTVPSTGFVDWVRREWLNM